MWLVLSCHDFLWRVSATYASQISAFGRSVPGHGQLLLKTIGRGPFNSPGSSSYLSLIFAAGLPDALLVEIASG
ncbi:hypothetical protein EV126DRAFT_425270 [Verticillium dahliae]|nr:hypothetical protein EV126DRAFT_425270 [Verticillium dahliae]